MILGNVDDLKQTKIQCINVEENSLLLIYQSNQFYLLDNLCPHKGEALCEGQLTDDVIECPWHKARFDIKTGSGLSALAGNGVKSWPLTIEGAQLSVDLS